MTWTLFFSAIGILTCLYWGLWLLAFVITVVIGLVDR